MCFAVSWLRPLFYLNTLGKKKKKKERIWPNQEIMMFALQFEDVY